MLNGKHGDFSKKEVSKEQKFTEYDEQQHFARPRALFRENGDRPKTLL